jgi:protein phosphatase
MQAGGTGGLTVYGPDDAGWLAVGLSDVGRLRSRNEDSFAIVPDLCLYLVADGMGGHRGGDVASRLTCDKLVTAIGRHGPVAGEDGHDVLAAAISEANQAVLWESERSPELAGMGTTLSLISMADAQATGRAVIAQVGDSRIYALTSRGLTQVTDDQTLAMDMVRRGEMTVAEAKRSGVWHVLSQALGVRAAIEPALSEIAVAEASAILLCSDGLSEMVADDRIEALMTRHLGDPAAAAAALVDAALDRGGVDNVTVVLLTRPG